MLVLTIQKQKVVEKICKGEYSANYWMSDFAFQSVRFAMGYSMVKEKLSEKTGSDYLESDTPYWGWVLNPYFDFFKVKSCFGKYSCMFVEVPKEELVFSDYDLYTDFVLGNSDDCNFFLESIPYGSNKCVQCSFMNLSKDRVKAVVPLDKLESCKGETVEDLLKFVSE